MTARNNILTNSRLAIILHILAWVIIMLLPRYIVNTYGDGNKHFLYHLYINIGIYGLLFYINYTVLVPRLFLNGKKISYLVSVFCLLIIFYAGMWYINEYLLFDHEHAREMARIFEEINREKEILKPPIRQFRMLNNFYTSVMILGFSLGLRLLEKVSSDEKKRKELEKEKLNSELAFLKNQISPHFFFNTLNNIYSLIGIDPKDAQESVLKLSKLMRYLLYKSEKGESKLTEEIAFLNNYIDLMILRLNNKVKLSISLPSEYPNHTIPPLLFIPFVENSFKHGVSYREPSFIDIEMKVSETQIIFYNRNSNIRSRETVAPEYVGIGLENVKKRLNLLFPNSHSLNITGSYDEFSVKLILFLKPDNEKV